MTDNEKARDLLAMIEVKEPGEFIVHSWWGSFAKDYKEALQIAIKALEKQPCEDCISREEALNVVHKYFEHYLQLNDDICLDGLRSLPSVTPKKKTGHWIKTPKAVMGEGYMWYCDKCQYEVYQDTSKNYPSERYCPNCGARMVEPPESEE